MPEPGPAAAKKAWRRRLRSLRKAMPPAHRRAADAVIAEALLTIARGREARVVAVYATVGSEVDTLPFATAWLSAGGRLAWPRVMGPGGGGGLTFWEARPGALEPGYRGILEPAGGATPVPIEDLDLLLVPGLGFDRAGRRLGQGGGFYDRALSDPGRHAPSLGLAYGCQVIARVPAEVHDVPLEGVLTELGLASGARWHPTPLGPGDGEQLRSPTPS